MILSGGATISSTARSSTALAVGASSGGWLSPSSRGRLLPDGCAFMVSSGRRGAAGAVPPAERFGAAAGRYLAQLPRTATAYRAEVALKVGLELEAALERGAHDLGLGEGVARAAELAGAGEGEVEVGAHKVELVVEGAKGGHSQSSVEAGEGVAFAVSVDVLDSAIGAKRGRSEGADGEERRSISVAHHVLCVVWRTGTHLVVVTGHLVLVTDLIPT